MIEVPEIIKVPHDFKTVDASIGTAAHEYISGARKMSEVVEESKIC